MKKLKEIFSLLIVVVLTFAMGQTAFAAGSAYTVTIQGAPSGHIYEAYQIFAGDVAANTGGKLVLSNIQWGDGVKSTYTTGKDAAAKAKALITDDDARAFAEEVGAHLDSSKAKTGTYSGNNYEISGLKPGYYLIKDKDGSLGADDIYTSYIMKVVGDVTVKPKGEKPTIDKKIDDGGAGKNANGSQIGDEVKFKVTATVPNVVYEDYDTYFYEIQDTVSDGLTLKVTTGNADGKLKITVNNDSTPLGTGYYTVTVTGQTLKIRVDVKKAVKDGTLQKNDKLVCRYSAELNKNAIIEGAGNTNDVKLVYSNNPNGSEKGTTVEKKVYDFTFEIKLNKVNGADEELQGAKFVLSKNGGLTVAVDADGTPTNKTGLIGLIKVTDNEYRVADQSELTTASIVYVIDAGKPTIKGLAGNTAYYLYETKAPEGYNKLKDPVQFEIKAEFNGDGSQVTSKKLEVNGVQQSAPGAAGDLIAKIVNNEGATLPETGGIGTTIFYVVGSILLVAAGIALITNKRMGKNAVNRK